MYNNADLYSHGSNRNRTASTVHNQKNEIIFGRSDLIHGACESTVRAVLFTFMYQAILLCTTMQTFNTTNQIDIELNCRVQMQTNEVIFLARTK